MKPGFTIDQALAEASRCLLCHDAPCSTHCPASTAPDRFIRALRFRNVKGAIRTIKERNVLGGICGTVCPTSDLCVQGCVASGIGEPIRIGELQRFLVEHGWHTGYQLAPSKPSNGHKVAVVGGGPAGLTCAAELAKEGCQAIVFEKRERAGGMLAYGIPNHRMSREFLERELDDVRALGVEIRCGAAVETAAGLDALWDDGFDAVFLATGAWRCLTLDVEHRDSDDVIDALSFLRAAKDADARFESLVKDREVMIIGGGDTAMDAALCAKRGGAREVSIVYRRSFDQMPGSKAEKRETIEAGVHLLILTQPVDYVIEDGRVRGLRVQRTRLAEPDASGRPRPVELPETEHTIAADTIVEALGLTPREQVGQLTDLQLDNKHRIVVKEGRAAGCQRCVFAGGDAVRGASIVANAVGDGKAAAAAILRELASGEVNP